MEAGKTYALRDQMLLFGALILEGFGEGSGIEITPKGPTWVSTEGVDGSAAWAYTGSKLFQVKIKLLQTAAANQQLQAIFSTQEETGALIPLVWKDTKGLDLFSSPSALIIQPPNVVRGSKIETQEWQIEASNGKLFLGGR